MAIDINVPSQIKNYANLAGFPVTGAVKTIFIAEDTNKTYRWTGSVYVEISASQAASWGTITGTLSTQTDLQNALNAKVPTSRTLTINGTTQDLSANRTFTVATGITIGTTAITSGVVGRVLFEGAGNVVSESANLFWDNVNGRLGVGTSSPAHPIDVRGLNEIIKVTATGGGSTIKYQNSFGSTWNAGSTGNDFYWLYNGVSSFMTLKNNGNLLINTTTDAGFKLDVNGTARINGDNTIIGLSSASQLSFRLGVVSNQGVSTRSGDFTIGLSNLTAIDGGRFYNNGTGFFWIDGYTEGATKAQNYPIVIGSRGSATGSSVGSYTTQENGSQTYFGFYAFQPSAQVIINSTTRGFLPPRMTTTQKNAIATPATGLMVYDTTLNLISVYNGTTWITL